MLQYEAIRPRYETSPEVETIVEAVSVCYQCGTCSGACPVVAAGGMDYTPSGHHAHDPGWDGGGGPVQPDHLDLRIVLRLRGALPTRHRDHRYHDPTCATWP